MQVKVIPNMRKKGELMGIVHAGDQKGMIVFFKRTTLSELAMSGDIIRIKNIDLSRNETCLIAEVGETLERHTSNEVVGYFANSSKDNPKGSLHKKKGDSFTLPNGMKIKCK